MRRCLLALLGMVLSTATAVASGPAENLRDALARMPALEAEGYRWPYVANFMDISAITSLAGSDHDRLLFNLQRLSPSYGVEAVDRLRRLVFIDDMQSGGTELANIRYVIGQSTRESETALWRFNAAASIEALLGTLRQGHHSPVPGPVPGVFTDTREFRLLLRDRLARLSPWYSLRGAAFLGGAGDWLIAARAAEEVARLRALAPERSLGQEPAVRTVLRGVEGASGRLVQAALLSPAIGLEQDDPARIMGLGSDNPVTDLPGIQRRLQAEAAAGVPPYLLAMIADLQDGERPVLLIALAYGDCRVAEAAAQCLRTLWNTVRIGDRRDGTFNDVAPAEISTRAAAAPDGQCAAVAEFRGPPGGQDRNPNPAHRLAGGALMQREFALLRIAVPAGR